MANTLGEAAEAWHGFRHLIGTALDEKAYEADWVERQIAHGESNKIWGIYNEAAYAEPRRKMMREWAGSLDRVAQTGSYFKTVGLLQRIFALLAATRGRDAVNGSTHKLQDIC